jgi:hypothetical protein
MKVADRDELCLSRGRIDGFLRRSARSRCAALAVAIFSCGGCSSSKAEIGVWPGESTSAVTPLGDDDAEASGGAAGAGTADIAPKGDGQGNGAAPLITTSQCADASALVELECAPRCEETVTCGAKCEVEGARCVDESGAVRSCEHCTWQCPTPTFIREPSCPLACKPADSGSDGEPCGTSTCGSDERCCLAPSGEACQPRCVSPTCLSALGCD